MDWSTHVRVLQQHYINGIISREGLLELLGTIARDQGMPIRDASEFLGPTREEVRMGPSREAKRAGFAQSGAFALGDRDFVTALNGPLPVQPTPVDIYGVNVHAGDALARHAAAVEHTQSGQAMPVATCSYTNRHIWESGRMGRNIVRRCSLCGATEILDRMDTDLDAVEITPAPPIQLPAPSPPPPTEAAQVRPQRRRRVEL